MDKNDGTTTTGVHAAKWRALCGLLDVPQDTPPGDIFSTVQDLRWLLPAAATA